MNRQPLREDRVHPNSLLLSIPLSFFRKDGRLYFERQATNGLRLWAENFDRVEVIARESARPVPAGFIPWDETQPYAKRIDFAFVPEAFMPGRFLRAMPAVRRRFRASIARNQYLCFMIGGLIGDWGAVAAREAILARRPFAVWTDRVESDVVRTTMSDVPWKRRLKARLTYRPMAALERYLIRHADLGLFHGQDTYDAYAPYSRHPALVHDVHVARDDIVSVADLAAKQAAIRSGPPELIYAGRMAAMKGWRDWLDVVAALNRQGMAFRATWLGDGEDRAAFLRKAEELGLSGIVSAPGNISDRAELRVRIVAAHGLLFCHKTKESPRILIEALRWGAPLIGYQSAYPADLISGAGGGILTPRDEPQRLAEAILALDRDRGRWANLMASARKDGEELYDEAVFRHRSDVIKRVLGDTGHAASPRTEEAATHV